MVTKIRNWSSVAADNNAAPPNGAPEGMAPSTVNNVMRENMAAVRDWYIDPAWICYGDGASYVSTTSFKITGSDATAQYVIGRRVRAVGSTTGTIYGVITNSVFSTDTTVTITWDSGSLSNEALEISVGLPALGKPVPYAALGLTGQITLADLANLAQATIIGRASGGGTGVPQALTSAQVATIANAGGSVAQTITTTNEQTGATYTFALTDAANTIVKGNRASAQTFTVPPNSSVAFAIGAVIPLYQYGAGQITIAQGSGVTVRTTETLKLRKQYSMAALTKIDTNEWVLTGDLEIA